jgi:hypothetical protein
MKCNDMPRLAGEMQILYYIILKTYTHTWFQNVVSCVSISLSLSIPVDIISLIISVCIYTYITHAHTHTYTHTHRKGSREIWSCSFTNTHAATFSNNPWIKLVSRRQYRKGHRHIETLDTDTRILRAHACMRSVFHTIKDTLAAYKHRRRMCVCVCVCVCVCGVCYCLKGEQSPSASVYGRRSLAGQPRAD